MTKELDKVTANILEDQKRFQKMFSDVTNIRNVLAHQIAPSMQAIKKINLQMAPTFKAIDSFNIKIAPYAKAMKNIEASLAPFKNNILEMQSHLNLISAFINTKHLHNPELVRLASQARNIAKIVADFQPETISEVYAQTVKHYSETESADPIQATISSIEEKIKSPGTVLNFEFYLSLVLSIILFLMSQSSSEESDELLYQRLDRLEFTLLQNYSAAEREEAGASFYIVKKSVNFRSGPSTKHKIFEVLFPNQKVKLVAKNSRWIEVEYYDHIDDSYKQGWVFKKYLKLLNPKKPAKYERP